MVFHSIAPYVICPHKHGYRKKKRRVHTIPHARLRHNHQVKNASPKHSIQSCRPQQRIAHQFIGFGHAQRPARGLQMLRLPCSEGAQKMGRRCVPRPLALGSHRHRRLRGMCPAAARRRSSRLSEQASGRRRLCRLDTFDGGS